MSKWLMLPSVGLMNSDGSMLTNWALACFVMNVAIPALMVAILSLSGFGYWPLGGMLWKVIKYY